MPQRRLQELSREECFARLRQEKVGRLVYQDDLGPVAVPVNYALAGENIVFRSEDGSKVHGLGQQGVAFEVDHIEDTDRSGWSVLVRGVGHVVDMEHVPDLVHQMGTQFAAPWKAGVHNIWVMITPSAVTGRDLGDPTSALIF